MVIYTVPLAFLGQAFMEICKKWQEKAGKILVSWRQQPSHWAFSYRRWIHRLFDTADERFQGAMNLCAVIQETCRVERYHDLFSNDCTMYFYSGVPTGFQNLFPERQTIVDDL